MAENENSNPEAEEPQEPKGKVPLKLIILFTLLLCLFFYYVSPVKPQDMDDASFKGLFSPLGEERPLKGKVSYRYGSDVEDVPRIRRRAHTSPQHRQIARSLLLPAQA